MTSLLGVWILVRSITGRSLVAAVAMIATFFTPLVLVNGAFVWPKLLAAACLCGAVALHFGKRHREDKFDLVTGLIVGALCALAMLSHGGSAFVLVGMAMAALMLWRFGSFPYIVAAVVTLAILYGPWLAYQRFMIRQEIDW